jgi:hypothetical protein
MKKRPVIYGAPPPPDSRSKHAKRTFVDGTYDYLGEPHLVDRAATHVKRRPAASSNGDKVAGPSRKGMAQKLKCEVVIPPVRPSRR